MMWKTYLRWVCIVSSWSATLGKSHTFRKCCYMYLQSAYFNQLLKKKSPGILQAKALKLDKLFSPPPSMQQCSGSAFSRQSAGSLERELWAKALWHGEVLQLMLIRHRSQASAFVSCTSVPLAGQGTEGQAADGASSLCPGILAFCGSYQRTDGAVPQSRGAGGGSWGRLRHSCQASHQ